MLIVWVTLRVKKAEDKTKDLDFLDNVLVLVYSKFKVPHIECSFRYSS